MTRSRRRPLPLFRAALVAALMALAAAPAAEAQDANAMLVADRVFLNGDSRLTAEGSVEVFYQGSRLTAARIVYDRATDRLAIEGPITLTDDAGTVMLASSADLTRDLQDGILRSARVVMDQQFQLAANTLFRSEGRYTQLNRVVASSCEVCPSNPVPLWEIRARRVVHDQEKRQLFFDQAQFRVMGMPILYLPRLRMPEPGVERATGFLLPEFHSTSQLGFGIKQPYFIAIGDSRDLTVTPYLSTNGNRSLELRYRQAYTTGRIELNGAISHDNILPGDTRGYFFGTGEFDLPWGYDLGLQVESVSDRGYLLDYGVSDQDRLRSGIDVTRTRKNEYIGASLSFHESLRAGDVNAVLPSLVTDFTFHRRFTPGLIGGEGGLRFETHSHRRDSTVTADLNGDGVADGRDVARATLGVDWRRNWLLPQGVLFATGFAVDADLYSISQDPAYPATIARVTPQAEVELRWPWAKATPGGAVHVIEPVAQFVWAPKSTKAVPNEDSLLVEFDEGSLFGFDRFPGADARELGARANLGLSWTRTDPDGWSAGVTVGRVIRAQDLGQFSQGTGLDGRQSDWLVAAQLATDGGLAVTNRALFDDSFDFTQNEFRLAWLRPDLDLGASYLWQVADPALGRPLDVSELGFDASWDMTDSWSGTVLGRYDFETDRATRAGIGLGWRNECALVDLSLSRRFTSSTTVRPSTDISVSVVLSGFGSGANGRSYRRSCGP